MHSYTAADTLPAKLLQDWETIKKITTTGRIPVIHVQLCPTNSCNLSCSYCSCAEEDRSLEMSYATLAKLVPVLKRNGCRAVTLTGGGEPLMHREINEMIVLMGLAGLKLGLTTNGENLGDLTDTAMQYLTWCRISHDDKRDLHDDYLNLIKATMQGGRQIDWAFSYVCSPEPDVKKINKLLTFASSNNMTHVRVVTDLLSEEKPDLLKLKLKSPLLVLQNRSNPERGMPCWAAYLKPLIAPDGRIYRCCGVQYALKTPSKKLPQELCIGHIDQYDEVIHDYTTVNQGLQCARCYYGDYNRVLGSLMEKLHHKDFQ